MILTSGKLKVVHNENKTARFFSEVEAGDIIEVTFDLNVTLSRGTGRLSRSTKAINHTKGTNRIDSPAFINTGLDKMVLEEVK